MIGCDRARGNRGMRICGILQSIHEDMVKRRPLRQEAASANGLAGRGFPPGDYFAAAGVRSGSTLVGRLSENDVSTTE